ncbi:MAG: ABC transporter permease [Chloroflexi bacterium]|nr:ABC transporter permease [Chloroflexota bacterium]
MRTYILRRLLLLPVIVLGVTILTFALFRIVPGDAIDLRCGISCTEEQKRELRDQFGLDRPFYVQYFDWLTGVSRGHLGETVFGEVELTKELRHRLPITGELLIMTVIFSLILGIPPGVISAIRPGTPIDWLARFVSVLGLSIPGFWLATLFIIFPVIWWNWSPPTFGRGFVPFFDDPWVNLQEFMLPSLALGLATAAGIMRLTRSSLLEVMRNDYIRTAWSKGLRERTVVWRHALKNAMIPVVTVLGLQVGGLLGGAVIIESIFALNGMGVLVLQSIVTREYFIVQGITFLAAIVYVTVNLAVDITYAWFDPRIRYT